MTMNDSEIAKRTTPAFAMVPAAALLDKRLTNAQRYVFSMMCLHANAQHYCWPKLDTLAAEMGVTKQAVSKTIQQLAKLGYVKIERWGFPPRNHYRINFELTPPANPEAPDETELQREVATGSAAPVVNLTLTNSQPHVDQQSTSEVDRIEQTRRTDQKNNVSQENLLVTSLAPARQAPPERRTRERVFDDTALKRDPIILAFAACLGREPATRREWNQWRLAVNDLHAAQIEAAAIPRAIKGYQTIYPTAPITPIAIAAHWSEIQEGKPHDLAQLEINRRASETAARQKAERERLNAERKAEQEREVDRLLSEYGYTRSG